MWYRFFHPAESIISGVSRWQLTTLSPSSWTIFCLVIYCKNIAAAPKSMAMTLVKLLFLRIAAVFCSSSVSLQKVQFQMFKASLFFPSLHSCVIPVMGVAETKNFRIIKLDYFSNYNILIKSFVQCLLYIMFLYRFLDLTWFIWAQGNWFHFYSYLGIWLRFIIYEWSKMKVAHRSVS